MKIKTLNKKGFTLIELLAVIVILGIILVIAVPQVLDIQRTSKKNAAKDEALFLADAINLCVAQEPNITDCAQNKKIGDYYENSDLLTSAAKTADIHYAEYVLVDSDGAKINKFEFKSNGYKIVLNNVGNVSKLKSKIKDAPFQ